MSLSKNERIIPPGCILGVRRIYREAVIHYSPGLEPWVNLRADRLKVATEGVFRERPVEYTNRATSGATFRARILHEWPRAEALGCNV